MKDYILPLIFGFPIFFLGYFSFWSKRRKKVQEQIAIQAGIGYYSVDQKDGTVKFKYNF